MAPINEAIVGLELRELGERYAFTEIAEKHGVNHSTVERLPKYLLISA
jgi:hypothetical protein